MATALWIWSKKSWHHGPYYADKDTLVIDDGSTPNPQRITDLGIDLQVMATVSTQPPILLIMGNPCRECDALPYMMIYSVKTKQRETVEYPGTISRAGFDDENGDPISSSALFYGNCLPWLPHAETAVAQFARTILKDGSWRETVTAFTFSADGVITKTRLIPETNKKPNRSSTCKEIPPQDQQEL